VQLPLPPQINEKEIIKLIDTKKDVDGFRSDSEFVPATPGGIMKYLEYCGWEAEGKEVTIIGRSDIVGRPLARLMERANATVTLCHSKTKNLEAHLKDADLVVVAVGKPNFLDCGELKALVIDVGINVDENGKLVGDCCNIEGKEVTPVPGGVGLLTRCMLLENVIKEKENEISSLEYRPQS
jgi:methylenetetrahydrofolate dehydrogenase (NADP+)/methenyltetrahydrofolate cyclohydrolase